MWHYGIYSRNDFREILDDFFETDCWHPILQAWTVEAGRVEPDGHHDGSETEADMTAVGVDPSTTHAGPLIWFFYITTPDSHRVVYINYDEAAYVSGVRIRPEDIVWKTARHRAMITKKYKKHLT